MPNKQSTAYGLEVAEGIGIRSVSLTLQASDFTDSSTTGAYTWTSALPAGCFYIGCKAVITSAFDDDTTATMTVGKTSGEDEFSDGASLNLAAVASVGQEGEAPLEYLASATTVYLLITSATDYTLVYNGDGEMTISLYYLSTVPE
jgi:hypothetical protein